MNNLKNYVKNNSKTLFKYNGVITNAEFDNKGFFFAEEAQLVYNRIKKLPHLYVAWTDSEKGLFYVGESNQPKGRWQRSHGYHLGTLAHHLLDTLKPWDQNHQHWIDSWMDVNTLISVNNNHNIKLYQEVKICFIPFELYSELNHLSLEKTQIRDINIKVEENLIKSYLLDGFELLNIKHNDKAKRVKIKKPINPSNKMITNSKISDNKYCVEFNVTRSQNIAIVANGIPNLPVGPCYIQIFYKNRADVRRYVNGNTRQIRTTNRTVSAFFQATDKINGMDVQKCQIVYDEMNDPNKIIEEITVRVCPIN
jgi:hypothetical protein